MWLYVTGTVLYNDCCVQTPRKNSPPKVYKFSKTPGVTTKFQAPGRVTKTDSLMRVSKYQIAAYKNQSPL